MQSSGPKVWFHVDVLGPFLTTTLSNYYILVAIEYFNKQPEAYAVPEQSATVMATKLVDKYFSRFTAPAKDE